MKDFLTTQQVAERLGLSTTTVTAYIRRKELDAYKIGRGYRVKESDLNNFINERKTAKTIKEGGQC